MLHGWMGMPMCHTILLQREKVNVNASLMNGNDDVPHNSDQKRDRERQCSTGMPMCHPILIKRDIGSVNASLLNGNANVPPNSASKRQGQC
jgi:hypothetical protein